MPDLTKCRDAACPRSVQCWRFTAPASERQSWFAPSPRRGAECDAFWPNGRYHEYGAWSSETTKAPDGSTEEPR